MGFEVYDYAAGKADWGSFGLPLEGDDPSSNRAGVHARRDVPTCGLADRLQDVRARSGDAKTCFVVDEDGVLLGRLGRSALQREDDVSAEEAMSEGPGTIRPSARLEWAVERMRSRKLESLPVTTPDGRLYGVLLLGDAETAR